MGQTLSSVSELQELQCGRVGLRDSERLPQCHRRLRRVRGQPHTARITYEPPRLSIFPDGQPVRSGAVDLSGLLGGDGSAWVGFTADGADAEHGADFVAPPKSGWIPRSPHPEWETVVLGQRPHGDGFKDNEGYFEFDVTVGR